MKNKTSIRSGSSQAPYENSGLKRHEGDGVAFYFRVKDFLGSDRLLLVVIGLPGDIDPVLLAGD